MSARFTPGSATAYIADDVLALACGGGVDPDVMSWCADTPDWDALIAATAGLQDAVIVRHEQDRLRVAATGTARAFVETSDGEQCVGGVEERTIRTIDLPLAVRLVVGEADAPAPEYCVEGGAVPASSVSRRLVASDSEAIDAFDALFGPTVTRTVEQAAVRDQDDDEPGPPLGLLVFSDGARVVLDRPMVLGRNPRPASGSADDDPSVRLVKIATSGVSRRHAAITVDRWRASIDDLGSSNGTRVTLPGRRPHELEPGRPVDLVAGAIVDLGGDVSFVVEEVA